MKVKNCEDCFLRDKGNDSCYYYKAKLKGKRSRPGYCSITDIDIKKSGKVKYQGGLSNE